MVFNLYSLGMSVHILFTFLLTALFARALSHCNIKDLISNVGSAAAAPAAAAPAAAAAAPAEAKKEEKKKEEEKKEDSDEDDGDMGFG